MCRYKSVAWCVSTRCLLTGVSIQKRCLVCQYKVFVDWCVNTKALPGVSVQGVLPGVSVQGVLCCVDTGKKIMHDPMAMRPFMGYNFGHYLQHWLDIGKVPGRKVWCRGHQGAVSVLALHGCVRT